MHRSLLAAALVLAVGGGVLVGCQGKTKPATPATPGAPGAAAILSLRDVQSAVDAAGGYRLTVAASNLVLPQWGGSDGGWVEVGKGGVAAVAELARTGEGGPYRIQTANGMTWFKRATCPTWARIPGGGADVLGPFLFTREVAFARAPTPRADRRSTADLLVLETELAGLGAVTIEIDVRTRLPLAITGANGLHMSFTEWGKDVQVTPPGGNIPDRGPGGNPC